jgi:hypothetical protein
MILLPDDGSTVQVYVSDSAQAGKIVVNGLDSIGRIVSTRRLSVKPVNPVYELLLSIDGPLTVEPGDTVRYRVAPSESVEFYTWELPAGFYGYSTSNEIWVRIDSTALSGTIYVRGENACGGSQWNYQYVQVDREEIPVGIVPQRMSWTCYPNPFKDKLYLVASLEQHEGAVIIEVYDVFGRLVKLSQTAMQPEMILDLHDLPSGIYMINMKSGSHYEWVKAVKQQP